MNTEDFVTYEQSLALKKLGFDYDCDYNYSEDKELYKYDYHSDFYSDTSSDSDLPAPTLAQAQEWLREKKSLYTFADGGVFDKGDRPIYYPVILDVANEHNEISTNDNIENNWNKYYTPEEALSAGITECLKLLEKED